MPECYIRGSTIKYLRIPDEVIDMVKEEVVVKSRGRSEVKGRGGQQRGRGAQRMKILYEIVQSSILLVHCKKSLTLSRLANRVTMSPV